MGGRSYLDGLRDSSKKSLKSAAEAPNASRLPSRNPSPESPRKRRVSRRGLTRRKSPKPGESADSDEERGLATFLVHLLRDGRCRPPGRESVGFFGGGHPVETAS